MLNRRSPIGRSSQADVHSCCNHEPFTAPLLHAPPHPRAFVAFPTRSIVHQTRASGAACYLFLRLSNTNPSLF
jgi:hypothetical protein